MGETNSFIASKIEWKKISWSNYTYVFYMCFWEELFRIREKTNKNYFKYLKEEQ